MLWRRMWTRRPLKNAWMQQRKRFFRGMRTVGHRLFVVKQRKRGMTPPTGMFQGHTKTCPNPFGQLQTITRFIVEMAIQGIQLQVMVDTGIKVSVLSTMAIRRLTPNPPRKEHDMCLQAGEKTMIRSSQIGPIGIHLGNTVLICMWLPSKIRCRGNRVSLSAKISPGFLARYSYHWEYDYPSLCRLGSLGRNRRPKFLSSFHLFQSYYVPVI